jgi:hypothetical protein
VPPPARGRPSRGVPSSGARVSISSWFENPASGTPNCHSLSVSLITWHPVQLLQHPLLMVFQQGQLEVRCKNVFPDTTRGPRVLLGNFFPAQIGGDLVSAEHVYSAARPSPSLPGSWGQARHLHTRCIHILTLFWHGAYCHSLLPVRLQPLASPTYVSNS